MKRKKYESPVMTEVLVELEQGFLSASTFEPGKPTGVEAGRHEIGSEFDYSDTDEWDQPITIN